MGYLTEGIPSNQMACGGVPRLEKKTGTPLPIRQGRGRVSPPIGGRGSLPGTTGFKTTVNAPDAQVGNAIAKSGSVPVSHSNGTRPYCRSLSGCKKSPPLNQYIIHATPDFPPLDQPSLHQLCQLHRCTVPIKMIPGDKVARSYRTIGFDKLNDFRLVFGK